jgi:ABC-type sugar transport system permease subunit
MFIWTVQDVVNAIVFIAILLFLALLGGLILAEKIQRKFKAWRRPRA